MSTHDAPSIGFSKHRVEALADGIFAVAMTLLVIDLKPPARADIHTQWELIVAVLMLIPKFISWIISFFVLAIFWFSHHRQFHFVRTVDAPLLWINILYLGFVSLMPFSSSLSGEHSRMLFTQAFYSGNMILLALGGLLLARHVYHHPELCHTPVPAGFYRASLFRIFGLVTVALVAVGICLVVPGAGNVAFMLMMPISILSRRIESGTR